MRENKKSSVAETSRFGLSGTESDLHSRFSSSKSKVTLPDLERVLQDLTATTQEPFPVSHLYFIFLLNLRSLGFWGYFIIDFD